MDAQGTFQNLGFESAVIVPLSSNPPPTIQSSPAFPGWAGYVGTQQVSYAFYNTLSIGSAVIGMFHSNFPASSRISGRFTPILQSGSLGLQNVEASLRQSGTVPAGSASLRFLADGSTDSLQVVMNGQPLNFVHVQSFNNYSEFGADISQYAGQTVELRFVQPYVGLPLGTYLDNIAFSPIPIPEPSAWALLALGSAWLWFGNRQRRK
jgi:hypothetical protein